MVMAGATGEKTLQESHGFVGGLMGLQGVGASVTCRDF